MPDILVRPAANDDDDLTGAFIMNDVTLPLTSQAALALGMQLGTQYKFEVLGAPALLTVTAARDVTVVATNNINAVVTSRTLPSVPLGPEAPSREIFVFYAGRGTFTSGQWRCTVGGGTPVDTFAFQNAVPGNQGVIFGFRVPTPNGTAGDVTISRLSGAEDMRGGVIIVLRSTGNPVLGTPVIATDINLQVTGNGETPNGCESPAGTINLSITTAAGSALLALAGYTNGPPTVTAVNWTGITEVIEGGTGTGGGGSAAFDNNVSSGAKSITVTPVGAQVGSDIILWAVEFAA